jgi:hypothetical protein
MHATSAAAICTASDPHDAHSLPAVPIPPQGTKQIKRLEENVGGFELSQRISKADLDELSSFFHMDAAVGDRSAFPQCCRKAFGLRVSRMGIWPYAVMQLAAV